MVRKPQGREKWSVLVLRTSIAPQELLNSLALDLSATSEHPLNSIANIRTLTYTTRGTTRAEKPKEL